MTTRDREAGREGVGDLSDREDRYVRFLSRCMLRLGVSKATRRKVFRVLAYSKAFARGLTHPRRTVRAAQRWDAEGRPRRESEPR
jgi:hypothetical protein